MNFQPQQLSLDGDWSLRHVFFDDVLFGIRACADARNIDLLVLTEMPARVANRRSHFPGICKRHGAAGIIVIAFEPRDAELASIAKAGLPCVAVDTHLIGTQASFVTSDNVGGGVAAVHHLFAAGKRRIAFVGGVATTVASSNRRLGYESGIEELGLEARDGFVLETDWQPATAYAKVRALLDSEDPPDAFFCVSDELALGTMHAIEESGRRIPDDVAVVGFDDADFARVVNPSLTSIRQDRIRLGATALDVLLQMLEKPDAPFPVSVLPFELIERESSSRRKPALERGRAEPTGSSSQGRLSIATALSMLTWGTELPQKPAGAPVFTSDTRKRANQRPLIAVALGTAPEQSFPRGFLYEVFLGIRAQAHAHEIDLLVLPSIEAARDSAGKRSSSTTGRSGHKGS